MHRIAIVDNDRCKPKNCLNACKRNCPVVKIGKQCIVVESKSKVAEISEILCNGCGICVKKCPYGAIKIINLPSNLNKDTTHRFSANSFKLHRLPTPKLGQVLGLIGQNGIGKSTVLKILAGKIKPNLGQFENPPDWLTIQRNYRGSELQNYFSRISKGSLKVVTKPQFIDQLTKGPEKDLTIEEVFSKNVHDKELLGSVCKYLDLVKLLDHKLEFLSGGELQRFAIATCLIQKSDMYMFDEPSSYLDIKQRLQAAEAIRKTVKADNYVLVVEHDLAVLDYLSDFVCCLYGAPTIYGVVTLPSGVREGINIFLDGFIPTENLRFRNSVLSFKVTDQIDRKLIENDAEYCYPDLYKKLGDFELYVEKGTFTSSEIIILLGENGMGKTSFIRLLAGALKLDDDSIEMPKLNISYKPQRLNPRGEMTVRSKLFQSINDMLNHPTFKTDVMNPLLIEPLLDLKLHELSGGELQRVALCLCLGKAADVYLIDEPSAYLDSEQRLHSAKVIKRFILHAKKTAFIVEHDFIMSTYLADRVIVFDGIPAAKAFASTPTSLVDGMNKFLKLLDITFRRDNETFRPRINKKDSNKDVEQKRSGNYFFIEN
uniref:RNase L inhibitor n=1 Tax=Rhabditophanes sp. KR3021 TaxID=114890 RepID=A0AC35TZ53_9BILA